MDTGDIVMTFYLQLQEVGMEVLHGLEAFFVGMDRSLDHLCQQLTYVYLLHLILVTRMMVHL